MNKNITDHLGMITACACIVHCIALPFLLFFSFLPSFEQFHSVTLGITVLITGHALWHGWKQHCRHIVVFFGVLGTLCLVGGMIAHEFAHGHTAVVHGNHMHLVPTHNEVTEFVEVAVTVIGSSLIIAAHWFNLKFKKCCNHAA